MLHFWRPSYFMRDCPFRDKGSMSQPIGSVEPHHLLCLHQGVNLKHQLVEAEAGVKHRSGGGQNRIYALTGWQDQESSPDIVTCILLVFSYDVYAFIDPSSTL